MKKRVTTHKDGTFSVNMTKEELLTVTALLGRTSSEAPTNELFNRMADVADTFEKNCYAHLLEERTPIILIKMGELNRILALK